MKITDETLSAFLDAELPEPEMEAVREQLQADPALSDRLAQLATVDDKLSGHYSTIDDEPLPESITGLLEGTAPDSNVVSFPWWRRVRQGARRHTGMAVAASLVMALGMFQFFSGGQDEQWQVVATALENAPSGTTLELDDGRTLTARLTFENQQGDYCRQFNLQGGGSASENIACRSGESWNLAAEKEVTPAAETEGYRTASGGSVLDDELDQMMAGEAISPEEERRLIGSGWQE